MAILSQVFHPLSTPCVLPVIILAFLNYRILVKSRRLNSSTCRQVISMAKVMMTIVTVFIILSIPKLVFGLYEVSTIPNIMKCHARRCRYYISSMRWVVDSIIRYMGLLNSSVNFIIYCCVGSNFRRTFMTNMRGMWKADDTPNGTRFKKDVTMETLITKTSEIEAKSEGEDRKEINAKDLKAPIAFETETLIETEQCKEIRKEDGTEMSLV